MLSEPIVQYREEQPYVAIETTVDMKDIPTLLPPLIPEVINWLAKNKIAHDSPPFFEYLRFDNDQKMLVHVGFPVAKPIKGDGRVIAGSFPSGNYVSAIYTGDYSHLKDAHMTLESWIKKNDLKEGRQTSPKGEEWGSRTEVYLTNPEEEPSPEKWKTKILLLLENE
jgi:effector-binding domain-containing protein